MYYLTGQLISQLKAMKESNATAFDPKKKDAFNWDYLNMLIQNFPKLK